MSESQVERKGPAPTAAAMKCGHCGTSTAVDSRFCSSCGGFLFEDCLACGESCLSGETFCNVCGANIKELLADKTADMQQLLSQADKLSGEYEFDHAIALLRMPSQVDHIRLKDLAQQMKERVGQYRERQQDVRRRLEEGSSEATELMKKHAYREVVQLLESLPERVRKEDESLTAMLVEARAKNVEVNNLTQRIKQQAEQRAYAEAARSIERLLELQPGRQKVEELAAKVATRLFERAKKHLSTYRYAEALQALHDIPKVARNEAYQQLNDTAQEFVWMQDAIRLAPVIDPQLLQIVQRLRSLAPDDERSKKLGEEIEQKAKAPIEDPRFPIRRAAAAPRRTNVGIPVDWIGGFGRFKCGSDAVQKAVAAEPGAYFLAAGLALHGIGRAECELDLSTSPQSGVLGRIGRSRKKPAKTAWGVDVGDFSVKVVKLVAADDRTDPVLETVDILPHSLSLATSGTESRRTTTIQETLQRLAQKYSWTKHDAICVGIPSHTVLGRYFTVPGVKKIQDIVRYEASHRIPIPLEELFWGYVTRASEAEPHSQPAAVALLAVKRSDVTDRLRLFQDLGLTPYSIQCDAVALHNYARLEAFSSDHSEICLVDVGCGSTNIVVSGPEGFWFRCIRTGGQEFSNALVREFNLTLEQAELLKREPTRSRRLYRMHMTCEPVYLRITSEVQRSLGAYGKEFNDRQVTRMFGCGNGFRMHGLPRYLVFGR